MVTQNPNPFILPGFGQAGDPTQNPMLASMEMMRKAWEGLASAGGFEKALATPGVSPEDLERRITDLRAVENWLRMNLSMLSSTIQALEVQRATVSTLQAFVASATGASNPASAPPSPLDIALGIRRGPSGDSSGLFGDKASAAPAKAEGGPSPSAAASTDAESATDKTVAEEGSTTPGIAEGAIQTWWDMLQTQFDNLASATAATLQGAEAMQDAVTTAPQQPAGSTRTAADPAKKPATTKAGSAPKAAPAKKAATKPVTKKAVKKTSETKAAPRKADGTVASAGKTATAAKTAAKKSAAKKTTAKKAGAKKAVAKKAVAKKATDSGAS